MANEYKDVDIQETTSLGAGGRIQKSYRVSATTSKGTRFSVVIPEVDMTKEKAGELLTAKAKELDSIKGL